MPEGSSILRENSGSPKNRPLRRIRLCTDDFFAKTRRKGAGVSCIRQARSNAVLAEKARRSYSFSKMAFMPRYVI